MPVAGYWRLRATLHWFDLWDRRWSSSAPQHYSLLQIRKSRPIQTNVSNIRTQEALFEAKERQTFSPVTCAGSVCPSWWWLLALDGLCMECPSSFIKQLGPRVFCWRCARWCQQESSMTVPAAWSQGNMAQEKCWAPKVLLLEMLMCMPLLALAQCWCCTCCCLLFVFFPLHPHVVLMGSTLSICLFVLSAIFPLSEVPQLWEIRCTSLANSSCCHGMEPR